MAETVNLFSLDAYQYELPQELIAQTPCQPRDSSRLMVIDRKAESFSEIPFRELANFLQKGDSLVFNDTRVIPARLIGTRPGGGQTEIFLLKRHSLNTWEALSRPGRKLKPGTTVRFGENFSCDIVEDLLNGIKLVQFQWEGIFEEALERYGRIPLPHYIHREDDFEGDEAHYQTVYAAHLGSVAAPTAGLHFTHRLMDEMRQKGVSQHYLTLHVGLGTFKPVQTEDIRDHAMHREQFSITAETAHELNHRPENRRQVCVGTTCCRTLETIANQAGHITPGQYETNIFIHPGYTFKYVRSLLTNFHLPGSTLLMLVCALGGYELIKEAYRKAVQERYRFYSYGDAMLII
jgi:S-adenosylmethionine:tRNA ribosyltransferase-isomerase